MLLALLICGLSLHHNVNGESDSSVLHAAKPVHHHRRSLQGKESLEQWLGVGHHHLRRFAKSTTDALGVTDKVSGYGNLAGASAGGAGATTYAAAGSGYSVNSASVPPQAQAQAQAQGFPGGAQLGAAGAGVEAPPSAGGQPPSSSFGAPQGNAGSMDVQAAAAGYTIAGQPGMSGMQSAFGAVGSALGLGPSKLEEATKEATQEAELGEEATLAQAGALMEQGGPPGQGTPSTYGWALYGTPPGALNALLAPPGVAEALEEEGVAKDVIDEAMNKTERTVPPAPPNGCLVDCELEWKGREVKRAQLLAGGLQALAEEEASLGKTGTVGAAATPAKDPCTEAKEKAAEANQKFCDDLTAANEACMAPVEVKAKKGAKGSKVDTAQQLANCAKGLRKKQKACAPFENVKTMCAAQIARAERKKNKKKGL
ncbi:hypothetical protein CYMTET_9133 [Cymbomonas tetramitiformis]|uniref:Uncharacterized protein n=1 Tax=Cymbomonas tetramitiformis TaxID=36881 RepID=A0AAE0GSC2_9CHLO|nr:hypothetical protein CYMTET_9133 [Cymbomonas tetramitiformis]